MRVVKRVVKDPRVPLAESLSDKLSDIFHKIEAATKCLILNVFFAVFRATKGIGDKETTSMSSLIKKSRAIDCHFQNPIPKFQARL